MVGTTEKLNLWAVKKDLKPLTFEIGKELGKEAEKIGVPYEIVKSPILPKEVSGVKLDTLVSPELRKVIFEETEWTVVSKDPFMTKILTVQPLGTLDASYLWYLFRAGKIDPKTTLRMLCFFQRIDPSLRMRSLFFGYNWRDIQNYWKTLHEEKPTRLEFEARMKKLYGFQPFELYESLMGIPRFETPEDLERVASVQAFLLQQLPPDLLKDYFEEKKVPIDKMKKVMKELLEKSKKRLEEVI